MNVDLFNWRETRARTTDPDTSHTAAAVVSGDDTEYDRRTLAAYLQSHPEGITSQDYAVLIGRELCNVSPAFAPLAREHVIGDSLERAPGARPGCKRIIWKAWAYLTEDAKIYNLAGRPKRKKKADEPNAH